MQNNDKLIKNQVHLNGLHLYNMPSEDYLLSDDYVASLLAKDARESTAKYSAKATSVHRRVSKHKSTTTFY